MEHKHGTWTAGDASFEGFDMGDSIDAAMAEAEAALPEGWNVCMLMRVGRPPEPDRWQAQAEPTPAYRLVESAVWPHGTASMWLGVGASGPTLSAALRALAERLRHV